jgi:signal transduction histidine kinase
VVLTLGSFALMVTTSPADMARLQDVEQPWGVESDALSLALGALATVPLAFRRRWPLLLLVLTAIPLWTLDALDYYAGLSGLAMLILLYTVAAYRGMAISLAALVYGFLWYGIGLFLGQNPMRWTDHIVTAVLLVLCWVMGRNVRLRRAYLAELVDRAERLERAREADTRAARAEERSRIARELHDVVAHHVSVMTVQASAARTMLDAAPDVAREALTAIEEMGRTAMTEMRNIVGVLRTDGPPELGPQPGMHDLPLLVEQMREAGLHTQLWIEGEQRALPPGVDLAAYRLVQEALTNSLRHAGPQARAWVTVRQEPSELMVHIEDDGRGATTDLQEPEGRGHGLVGIRERVALYGGVLRIGPRNGGGFEVRARFPLKEKP